jgi:FkbH-like protein
MLRYNLSQLSYIALDRASRSLDWSDCTRTVRVALLSDSAPQYLTPLFRTLLCRSGIRAEMYEADYGTSELEVLDPASGLYAFKPDVVVMANAVFTLRDRYYAFKGDRTQFAGDQMNTIASLWSALRARSNAAIIQTNYVVPNERLFGNYDHRVGISLASAVVTLNQKITEGARTASDVFVCDIDHLAAYYGRKHWLDEKMWLLGKAFCAFEYLPHVVQSAVDIILSLNGDGVKCVVLDLDDTLWGGIIGDDGLEGIRLGHLGDGEAFVNFQHFLRGLKERGILLAVCSKNDPDTALLPFRRHPEMVLREQDITVFVANWVSKAENIRQIREALNLSFSSLVFLDDNPFERAVVRDELPEVVVPELPEDPADYVRCLTELNLFETTSYSPLDAARADLYRVGAQRKLAEKQFANPEDHLKSLEMKVTCRRFEPFHLPRIAQLLQRSNQFNLLTRRYNQTECEAFMHDTAGWLPIYLSLRDKYGDNGLISVVIARLDTPVMSIEEWVMSCRVLARGVEQFTMDFLFDEARKRGVELVRARYAPTAKNGMVKNFFGTFGFRNVGESADGAIDWELETAAYRPGIHFIELDAGAGEAVHAAR